ncbi:DUF1674 domain-containing protein [Azospirillum baldaniorum]|uniref:DUF1674 domain-containing protein n=1 Tax=Azospirillum baldaniorum TaxID=1064539 RepID=A0A9P1NK78_9PROT|nr:MULTISPECIES: succinate dehydrogenase assembly factor 4 [Azospirillum]AWJ88754.1 DUF1674 domain-containing protein [Azospirillum baldaniorum]TWA62309.1 hypothetical protein FBZ84_11184 [Azospirillum baldaniorum]TWA79705.1 hypothetical protein FBZ85_10442 [Azospirillum brasilense]CCC96260.1 conserved hypothetical protein [Azospirillum baldaniorum]
MTETKTTGPAPEDAVNPASPATKADEARTPDAKAGEGAKGPEQMPGEIGGPQGPEPTRFGDWEFKGRCSDF